MFSFNIDLGQIIIASLIAIVGWFVKKTIQDFGARVDRHENILFGMAQDVQYMIGVIGAERRKLPRDK